MARYRSSGSGAMAFRQIASSVGSTSARCFEGGAGGASFGPNAGNRPGLSKGSRPASRSYRTQPSAKISVWGPNVLDVAADLLGRRIGGRPEERPRLGRPRTGCHPARQPARSRSRLGSRRASRRCSTASGRDGSPPRDAPPPSRSPPRGPGRRTHAACRPDIGRAASPAHIASPGNPGRRPGRRRAPTPGPDGPSEPPGAPRDRIAPWPTPWLPALGWGPSGPP